MNRKLLLGALIGAGIFMLNRKMRQQPQVPPGGRAEEQADSRIDGARPRYITKALEGKLDSADLEEFRELLAQPVDMEQVVARVNDPATALTVNEDNPKEKAYMDELAEKFGISEKAVQTIEQQLPRAA